MADTAVANYAACNLNSLLYFLYFAISDTPVNLGIITSRPVSVICLAPQFVYLSFRYLIVSIFTYIEIRCTPGLHKLNLCYYIIRIERADYVNAVLDMREISGSN